MADTLGSMTSRIANKLIVDDMDSEIEQCINGAIEYYKSEPFWFTQAEETITLTINSPLVPDVPSDVLYERNGDGLVLNYSQRRWVLSKVDNTTYDLMNVQATGIPNCYTYRDGNYYGYFYPDQAYTLLFRYQKSYSELVQTSDSNDWLANAPRLIEAKALCDFYLDYRHEPEMSVVYGQKALTELQKVRDESYGRLTTGNLITENIIDKGDYYYDPTVSGW